LSPPQIEDTRLAATAPPAGPHGSLRERAWEAADTGDDDQFVGLGVEEGFGVIAAGTVCITFKVEIDRPWPTRRNLSRDGRRRAEG
jgi:hypothetical protein